MLACIILGYTDWTSPFLRCFISFESFYLIVGVEKFGLPAVVCWVSAWASSSAFNRRLQVFFIIWPIQRQHPLLVQGKICTVWAPVSILPCLKLHMKSLLSRSSRIRCFFHGRLSELQFVKVRLIRLSVYSFHLCLSLASFSKWLASSVVEDKEDSRIQVIKKKSGKTLHSTSLPAFIRIMLFHLQWVLDVRAESSYFK